MSRTAAWINKDIMEREDVSSIIDDDAQDLKLYRFTELSSNDGFREQSPKQDYRYIRTVRGRIDRRDKVYQSQTGDVSKSVDTLYIATLHTKNIKIDDELFDGQLRYRVTVINKVGAGFTEAEVEIKT